MRVLGLDVGERRIGVALSDPEGRIALGLTVVEPDSEDMGVSQVLAVARENAVERIVVGLPRSLDGSLGRQAQAVQAFAQLLAGRSDVPVVTWDERFSTVAADKMLAEAGVKRAKRKARRDSTAAAFILQGYLDHEKGDSVGGG